MSGPELLEQALHRCRGNRNGAMASYFIGTCPFLVGLLYFSTWMSTSPGADSYLLSASLGMACLWTWMNWWHALFCRQIWTDISDEPAFTSSTQNVVRVTMIQSAIQGAAVIALPFAAFITLPFAWVYAIFQNADVFATTSDLSAVWRKSREQAFLWPKQNWQLLACALLLGTIIFVNVMLSFLFGAQLLHSVLGVQTALTRSRFAFLNSTLIGVAAAISYLAVNPILKAAYVIRCFEGESLHTGADLRLVLRRASILVVLLFAIHPPSVAAPVQQYDQAIDSVLRRPEYSWRLPKSNKVNSGGAIAQVVTAAGDWAERIAKSILEFLRKMSPEPQSNAGAPGSPGTVRWAIVIVSAIVIAGAGFLVIRFGRRSKKATMVKSQPLAVVVDLNDESVAADQLPEDEWLQVADRLLAQGDTRLAVRAIFLSALAQLHREGMITLSRHKTNLEYDRELARRSRGAVGVRATFLTMMDVFECCWYGTADVDRDSVSELRNSLSKLRAHA